MHPRFTPVARSLHASVASLSAASGLVGLVGLAACSGNDGALDFPASAPPVAPMTDGGATANEPDATTASDAAPPPPSAPDASAPDATRDAAPPPSCPASIDARWSCDGTDRVRCVDNSVRRIHCDFGCNAPTAGDDATCGCGANSAFRVWNCLPDGNLYDCPGSIYVAQSCGGRGCSAQPMGVDDRCNPQPGNLQAVLTRLGGECGTYSPGTSCGLALKDFVTGEVAAYRGDAWHVSASSAKALWVAAALYDTSIASVQPFASPIFTTSDNSAAGKVIDLLSSPDRVNTFLWNDVAAPDSGFCHWSYDKTREATSCPATANGDNFFTANDTNLFLSALFQRTLLGDAASRALLGWMQLSPRTGYGGWLGTQLPSAARATMHHKAGWLPPSSVPGYSVSNEIGIVEVPGGHAYAVSILMSGGTDYDGHQLPTMEYASCVLYHAVASDVPDPFAACHHP